MPKLRPFQKEDVREIVKRELHVLLASSQGTGKTAIAVSSLARVPGALPAVVLCPVSMIGTWTREIKQWAPHLAPLVVTEETERLKAKVGSNTVVLVPWNLLHAHKSRLVRAKIQTVIADECHLVKNPDSLRGQALAYLRDKVRHVMLMTGTPVVNVKADLDVLLGYGKRPLHIIRRYLEDIAPDVPRKKRSYIYLQLRKHHRAAYDQAVEEFDEWLAESRAELAVEENNEQAQQALAADALARVGYLRRLVGEYKVPAAADWISRAVRLGEPVVVFLEHQIVLKKLTKALRRQRIRYVVLEGSSTEAQRDTAVLRFQANEVPVFIGTRAAMVGLTLTAARHLLFVERFWTSADEEQAEDRIRRIGQVHPTTIWFLHVPGTIDDRIDEIVREKRQTVHAEVGSMPVDETPTRSVQRVLTRWREAVQPPTQKLSTLGLGTPLEPLPSPAVTYALVFQPPRWTARAASVWCRMNGYHSKSPGQPVSPKQSLRFVVHPGVMFRPGTFKKVKIARDLYALVGVRLSGENESRIRKMLATNDAGASGRT